MVRLPQALENKRITLLALARRRAFESYLRYGRVPELHEQAAAFAVGAEKALGPETGVPAAALPRPKPTAYYTWRTAGDERVRAGHAAHAGQVFAWATPPDGGHPGAAPNCRCWAEPYYGNPDVPDALLKLAHQRQVDTTGREHWASIDTLRRPDGSLVESTILGRDGTRIYSTFVGSAVTHALTISDNQIVRVEKRDGVQRIYLGTDGVPLTEAAWLANGLQLTSSRIHVAQVVDDETRPSGINVYLVPKLFPLVAIMGLYNALRAKPDSLGAGPVDVPVVAFKVWSGGGQQGAAISVEALTAEQVSRFCPRLPDIQAMANDAAMDLAPLRPTMTPSRWGIALHTHLKRSIDALRVEFPEAYANVYAELSIGMPSADGRYAGDATYAAKDTVRLDVVEVVNPMLVCDYDLKSGQAGLDMGRVLELMARTNLRHPGAVVIVMEIRIGE